MQRLPHYFLLQTSSLEASCEKKALEVHSADYFLKKVAYCSLHLEKRLQLQQLQKQQKQLTIKHQEVVEFE
jgi:hypothetical protein